MIWGYITSSWCASLYEHHVIYSLLNTDTDANKNGFVTKNNKNIENFPP